MKKLFLILVLLVGLFSAREAYAADFRVECGSGCKTEGTSPLFSESEVWYPGKGLDRTFSLKNAGSSSKEMAIGVTGSSSDGKLEKVMTVEIVNTNNAEVVWPKDTLEKFYTQGKISLGTFAPGETKEFAFKVAMDSSADNEYQNRKSKFDLILGFWEEASTGPTATPTPTGSVMGLSTFAAAEAETEGELGGGIATQAGEVAGAKAPVCPFWWIVLLGQTLVLSGLYRWYSRKGKRRFPQWLGIAAIVLLANLIDRYAHTHWYLPNRFCHFELWLGAGLAVIQTKILQRLFRKKRYPRVSY